MTPIEVLDHIRSYSPHMRPDAKTYSMIVDVAIKWAKNPSDGPRFAEAVLDRLAKEAKTNPAVSPNTIMYGTVIDAWARSGVKEAPYKAEALLQKMQALHESGNHDVKPNTICFNSVITAWARSRDEMAAKRAELILNRMQELYESGSHDVKPNTISFNSVVNAWARSEDKMAAKRAELILNRMQELYE
jgi:hypothetical protein